MGNATAPSYETLMAEVAAGRATKVSHTVEGVRLQGSPNVYWISDPDPQGRRETRNGYMTVRDDKYGQTWATPRETWVQEAGEKLRRGAVGILQLLDSPLARILEITTGRSLAVLRNFVGAMTPDEDEEKILRLVQEFGRGRLLAVAEHIDKARADGVITPAEWAAIVHTARGGE